MSESELSLRPLAGATGVLCLPALDHRDALRNAFRRVGVEDLSSETMVAVKCRIAAALGGLATGILLDPDAIACRPPGAGLLVPLEEQGHEPLDGGRLTRLLDDFGPEQARRLGADGCKLLLYYRTDHPATAGRQRDLVARAAEDCHRHGLPLILEPLVYRLEGESEAVYGERFADLVVAAAGELSGSGADLLKLQFASEAACAQLTEASSPLPWALLGGSEVDGGTFARQLETACAAGAAGFIAGRAIWSGLLGLPDAEQEQWLARAAVPLFDRLRAIAEDRATGIR
jgi:tagatose-1,6-bisphosphate aldolase